jgi:multimeric flavodoxin WrbA
MRILGLGCGEDDGSAEVLLKSALMAAERSGAETALVRISDLDVPDRHGGGEAGDGPWFWEQLMQCDGLIASSPVLSRTVPGRLRSLCDRMLGPNADAAFIAEMLRMRAAGEEPAVPFRVDERVLRPRVAGFIAVGGSLPDHWKTLALPLMHALTFSMQIAVADQVQFGGAGLPASIVLDDDATERAALLGRNVAEQLGRPFAGVEYRGPEGVCPMCHLSVIEIRETGVECATCGARGYLGTNGGDEVSVHFPPDGLEQSVISMAEKHAHFVEVQETAARLAPQADEIRARSERYREFDRRITP